MLVAARRGDHRQAAASRCVLVAAAILLPKRVQDSFFNSGVMRHGSLLAVLIHSSA
jgi:hypothetical protein